jgi:hypothetical protein
MRLSGKILQSIFSVAARRRKLPMEVMLVIVTAVDVYCKQFTNPKHKGLDNFTNCEVW